MPAPAAPSRSPTSENGLDDQIDLRELANRVWRGLPQTLGLAALGFAVVGLIYLSARPVLTATTSARVVFAFPGHERGEYPDKSKFLADDLRAADVVSHALERQGLKATQDLQSQVRAGITIEAVIPPSIIKERDRLRAAGQSLPALIPDEYRVNLVLPRGFPLDHRQRELLLNEIVSVYREKFQRTYADLPLGFGNAFETLKGADFFEYELVLGQELQSINTYLQQQLETAKTFRSQSTNLSYSDLMKQTQLFAQIRLNETLGLIRQNGLSKNRATAMVKMDYYLRTLEDQETKAVEEEKVVQNLLNQTRERAQNYVVATKTQQPQPAQPLLEQGFIDSLLANDAYNFLVREALKAGLKVKQIQSEKEVLLDRRRNMEAFVKGDVGDQSAIVAQVQASLTDLEAGYNALIENIRRTHQDYQHQNFADAVRVSMQARTESFYLALAKAAIVGMAIAGALGIGLSLLGIYIGRRAAA